MERNKPRLDYNFKGEIPKFHGSFKLEDFVDWLNTVERVFDYYEVMDEKKVKLVAICLKKGELLLGGNNCKFLAKEVVKSRSRVGRR